MKFKWIFILLTFIAVSCNQTPEKTPAEGVQPETEAATLLPEDARVHVVYFHGKQRCKSCVTIQKVASATVEEAFAGVDDVKFVEIDFSQKANEALADKYEVAWSSLFIIAGDRFTNLTDPAFTHALNNPDALKELIIKQTNEYLNP
jgi:hypothetical protein